MTIGSISCLTLSVAVEQNLRSKYVYKTRIKGVRTVFFAFDLASVMKIVNC